MEGQEYQEFMQQLRKEVIKRIGETRHQIISKIKNNNGEYIDFSKMSDEELYEYLRVLAEEEESEAEEEESEESQ